MKLTEISAVLLWLSAMLTGCTPGQATTNGSADIDSLAVSIPDTATDTTPLDTAFTLSFAFTGDIMMGTTWPDSTGKSGLPVADGLHLFDDVKSVLRRVDVACGNLEGSFLDGPGKRRPMGNPNTYFVFRMPTAYVDHLVDAGYDFVGLANNHINDFGEPGRQSTMATLRRAGICFAGLKNRCDIAIIERKGVRIALTQFGHGGNNLDVNDLDELRRVVKQMRDTADIVVVAFHGGAEGAKYTHIPHGPEKYLGEKRGDVEAFAHAAIDAGADVVYGHGPHVPRAAELYKGHIIFYSLGNFCTPRRMGLKGFSGYAPIAEVTLDSDGLYVDGRIHSFIQQPGRGPRADTDNVAAKLIRQLSSEDFPASPLVIATDGTLSAGQ